MHDQRSQAPLPHTPGHINCPRCEQSRVSAMRPEIFGTLLFPAAAEVWLNSRVRLSADSIKDYRKCIKCLTPFFMELRLIDIHIGHVQEYQKARASKPTRCNRELNVTLKQIMERADLWKNIEPYYEPLPLPKTRAGMALEPEEEKHLFLIAAKNPRWLVAYCASVLSRNTCMRIKEVRHLQLKNIDPDCKWVRLIDNVKNEAGIRTLNCNKDAEWALRQLLMAAKEKGASGPDDFLIPHRADKGSKGADPKRPIFSFYKSWYSIRREACKKFPRLAKVQLYDMRRTAATRLLENPDVPYNAIEHFMGHEVNSKTKRRYDYLRGITLSNTADALSSGHPEKPSNLAFIEPRKPQVIENNSALQLLELVAKLIENKLDVESLLKKPSKSASL